MYLLVSIECGTNLTFVQSELICISCNGCDYNYSILPIKKCSFTTKDVLIIFCFFLFYSFIATAL